MHHLMLDYTKVVLVLDYPEAIELEAYLQKGEEILYFLIPYVLYFGDTQVPRPRGECPAQIDPIMDSFIMQEATMIWVNHIKAFCG